MISICLFFIACFVAFIAFLFLKFSASALHEIEAFLLFLIAAVLITGSAIVRAIDALSKKLGHEKTAPKMGRSTSDKMPVPQEAGGYRYQREPEEPTIVKGVKIRPGSLLPEEWDSARNIEPPPSPPFPK